MPPTRPNSHDRLPPRATPSGSAYGVPPAPRRVAKMMDAPIGPSIVGTCMFLASLGTVYETMGGWVQGSDTAKYAAIVVGLGLIASAIADGRMGGLWNLVRADLFAMFSFYFLTLFEFLFPQLNYNTLVTVPATEKAIVICLWAFAGLAVGRHLIRPGRKPFRNVLTAPVSPGRMMSLFLWCTIGGYMNMLVATNFDVYHMVMAFMWPRFSQPWSRGRLGDWKALFDEISMLLFLLPPMAGIMLARRRVYNFFQISIVVAVLLFTFFYGYSSGTRNIFDSYLVTFLIGYAFATERVRRHELLYVAVGCGILLMFSTMTMVKFRNVGLKNYLSGEAEVEEVKDPEILSVDLNLFPMSRLAEVFPDRHPYLGFEIIYEGLIRPIPRAIWKSKPEGMSVSIEDMVGADGWTVAASFAGEAYMSGGLIMVFLCAALFGWLGSWWNRLVSEDNSQLGWLIYASGFFSVVISMRSMLVFTTAILPTIAAFAVSAWVIGKGVDRVQAALPGRQRLAPPMRTRPAAIIPRR